MPEVNEFFNPEVLFSASNPFLKTAREAHQLWFDSLDKTARLQLDFTRDLLDISRKRFESLYSGKSFADMLSAQQEFTIEAGNRGLALVEDVKAIATELQEAVAESASEIVANKPRKSSPVKATTKKAKAA